MKRLKAEEQHITLLCCRWALLGLSGLVLLACLGPKLIPPTVVTLEHTSQVMVTPTYGEYMGTAEQTPLINSNTSPTAAPIGLPKASPRDGMAQIYIPEGEFLMGTTEEQINAWVLQYPEWHSGWFKNETPQHPVYLDAYWIDQTEVTNAMYAKCISDGGCTPNNNTSRTRDNYFGNVSFDNYPVIDVDWDMAKAYCTWAGRHLPSEAEWEKAARGVDGRAYPWGNNAPGKGLLNYNMNINDTTAVGSYPLGASPYGALDMAGNVWEWVNDWSDGADYQQSPSKNPIGPNAGKYRVLRGGAWLNDDREVRSAGRKMVGFIETLDSYGFRCAVSP